MSSHLFNSWVSNIKHLSPHFRSTITAIGKMWYVVPLRPKAMGTMSIVILSLPTNMLGKLMRRKRSNTITMTMMRSWSRRMYTMSSVVHVLVAPLLSLTPQTLSITELTMKPHKFLRLWITSWLSTLKLQGLWCFGFRLGRTLFGRIWECINFVSQVIGFFHPDGFLRWLLVIQRIHHLWGLIPVHPT